MLSACPAAVPPATIVRFRQKALFGSRDSRRCSRLKCGRAAMVRARGPPLYSHHSRGELSLADFDRPAKRLRCSTWRLRRRHFTKPVWNA